MARRAATILVPLSCLVGLTGCGDSAISRGTSGAAIGAGAGAAVCAVTIIGVLPCAIVGGALGAAGGTATAGPDGPSPVTAVASPDTVVPPPPAPDPADSAPPVGAPLPRARVTAEPLQ